MGTLNRLLWRLLRRSDYVARSPRAPQDELARWFSTRELRRNPGGHW